jgi:hypothetical protein
MNAFLIALVAWSGVVSALDKTPPPNALRERQSCDTTVEGVSYDGQSVLKGQAKKQSHFEGERLTWTEGDVEYVVTRGERSIDRAGKVETFLSTRLMIKDSQRHETVEYTIDSESPDGSKDSIRTNEENDYKVEGNVRTLVSRWVDGEDVPNIRETITEVPVANGRLVTTVNEGPYFLKTSDSGDFSAIKSRTRACLITRI